MSPFALCFLVAWSVFLVRTDSPTASLTASDTGSTSITASGTISDTVSGTVTETITISPSQTAIPTFTNSETITASDTATKTCTASTTPLPTSTQTPVPTATTTSTHTGTDTETQTGTSQTGTLTSSPTAPLHFIWDSNATTLSCPATVVAGEAFRCVVTYRNISGAICTPCRQGCLTCGPGAQLVLHPNDLATFQSPVLVGDAVLLPALAAPAHSGHTEWVIKLTLGVSGLVLRSEIPITGYLHNSSCTTMYFRGGIDTVDLTFYGEFLRAEGTDEFYDTVALTKSSSCSGTSPTLALQSDAMCASGNCTKLRAEISDPGFYTVCYFLARSSEPIQLCSIVDIAVLDRDQLSVACVPSSVLSFQSFLCAVQAYDTLGRVFEARPHLDFHVAPINGTISVSAGTLADSKKWLYNLTAGCANTAAGLAVTNSGDVSRFATVVVSDGGPLSGVSLSCPAFALLGHETQCHVFVWNIAGRGCADTLTESSLTVTTTAVSVTVLKSSSSYEITLVPNSTALHTDVLVNYPPEEMTASIPLRSDVYAVQTVPSQPLAGVPLELHFLTSGFPPHDTVLIGSGDTCSANAISLVPGSDNAVAVTLPAEGRYVACYNRSLSRQVQFAFELAAAPPGDVVLIMAAGQYRLSPGNTSFTRGKTYSFVGYNLTQWGRLFIKTAPGIGETNRYDSGVVGNGLTDGVLTISFPFSQTTFCLQSDSYPEMLTTLTVSDDPSQVTLKCTQSSIVAGTESFCVLRVSNGNGTDYPSVLAIVSATAVLNTAAGIVEQWQVAVVGAELRFAPFHVGNLTLRVQVAGGWLFTTSQHVGPASAEHATFTCEPDAVVRVGVPVRCALACLDVFNNSAELPIGTRVFATPPGSVAVMTNTTVGNVLHLTVRTLTNRGDFVLTASLPGWNYSYHFSVRIPLVPSSVTVSCTSAQTAGQQTTCSAQFYDDFLNPAVILGNQTNATTDCSLQGGVSLLQTNKTAFSLTFTPIKSSVPCTLVVASPQFGITNNISIVVIADMPDAKYSFITCLPDPIPPGQQADCEIQYRDRFGNAALAPSSVVVELFGFQQSSTTAVNLTSNTLRLSPTAVAFVSSAGLSLSIGGSDVIWRGMVTAPGWLSPNMTIFSCDLTGKIIAGTVSKCTASFFDSYGNAAFLANTTQFRILGSGAQGTEKYQPSWIGPGIFQTNLSLATAGLYTVEVLYNFRANQTHSQRFFVVPAWPNATATTLECQPVAASFGTTCSCLVLFYDSFGNIANSSLPYETHVHGSYGGGTLLIRDSMFQFIAGSTFGTAAVAVLAGPDTVGKTKQLMAEVEVFLPGFGDPASTVLGCPSHARAGDNITCGIFFFDHLGGNATAVGATNFTITPKPIQITGGQGIFAAILTASSVGLQTISLRHLYVAPQVTVTTTILLSPGLPSADSTTFVCPAATHLEMAKQVSCQLDFYDRFGNQADTTLIVTFIEIKGILDQSLTVEMHPNSGSGIIRFASAERIQNLTVWPAVAGFPLQPFKAFVYTAGQPDPTQVSLLCTPNVGGAVSAGANAQCNLVFLDANGDLASAVSPDDITIIANDISFPITKALFAPGVVQVSLRLARVPASGFNVSMPLYPEFSNIATAQWVVGALLPRVDATTVACSPNPTSLQSVVMCTVTYRDAFGNPSDSASSLKNVTVFSISGQNYIKGSLTVGDCSNALCLSLKIGAGDGSGPIFVRASVSGATFFEVVAKVYVLESGYADPSKTVLSCPSTLVAGTTDTCSVELRDASSLPAFRSDGSDFTVNGNGAQLEQPVLSGPGRWLVEITANVSGLAAVIVKFPAISQQIFATDSFSVVAAVPVQMGSSLMCQPSPVAPRGSLTCIAMFVDEFSNVVYASDAKITHISGILEGTSPGTSVLDNGALQLNFTVVYAIGNCQVSVSLGDISLVNSIAITTRDAVATVANSSFTCSPPQIIAGASVTCSLILRDYAGRPASLTPRTAFTVKTTGFDPTLTLSETEHGPGTYSFVVSPTRSGNQVFNVSLQLGWLSSIVEVLPNAPVLSKTVLACSPATVAPGLNETCVMTFRDDFGNGASRVLPTELIVLLGGSNDRTFSACQGGTLTFWITANCTAKQLSLKFVVNGTKTLLFTAQIFADPGAIAPEKSLLSCAPLQAFSGETVLCTLVLLDVYGNPASKASTSDFIISPVGKATLTKETLHSPGTGMQLVYLRSNFPGSFGVLVSFTPIMSALTLQKRVEFEPGPAADYNLTCLPVPVLPLGILSCTVSAFDMYQNLIASVPPVGITLVAGYSGTFVSYNEVTARAFFSVTASPSKGILSIAAVFQGKQRIYSFPVDGPLGVIYPGRTTVTCTPLSVRAGSAVGCFVEMFDVLGGPAQLATSRNFTATLVNSYPATLILQNSLGTGTFQFSFVARRSGNTALQIGFRPMGNTTYTVMSQTINIHSAAPILSTALITCAPDPVPPLSSAVCNVTLWDSFSNPADTSDLLHIDTTVLPFSALLNEPKVLRGPPTSTAGTIRVEFTVGNQYPATVELQLSLGIDTKSHSIAVRPPEAGEAVPALTNASCQPLQTTVVAGTRISCVVQLRDKYYNPAFLTNQSSFTLSLVAPNDPAGIAFVKTSVATWFVQFVATLVGPAGVNVTFSSGASFVRILSVFAAPVDWGATSISCLPQPLLPLQNTSCTIQFSDFFGNPLPAVFPINMNITGINGAKSTTVVPEKGQIITNALTSAALGILSLRIKCPSLSNTTLNFDGKIVDPGVPYPPATSLACGPFDVVAGDKVTCNSTFLDYTGNPAIHTEFGKNVLVSILEERSPTASSGPGLAITFPDPVLWFSPERGEFHFSVVATYVGNFSIVLNIPEDGHRAGMSLASVFSVRAAPVAQLFSILSCPSVIMPNHTATCLVTFRDSYENVVPDASAASINVRQITTQATHYSTLSTSSFTVFQGCPTSSCRATTPRTNLVFVDYNTSTWYLQYYGRVADTTRHTTSFSYALRAEQCSMQCPVIEYWVLGTCTPLPVSTNPTAADSFFNDTSGVLGVRWSGPISELGIFTLEIPGIVPEADVPFALVGSGAFTTGSVPGPGSVVATPQCPLSAQLSMPSQEASFQFSAVLNRVTLLTDLQSLQQDVGLVFPPRTRVLCLPRQAEAGSLVVCTFFFRDYYLNPAAVSTPADLRTNNILPTGSPTTVRVLGVGQGAFNVTFTATFVGLASAQVAFVSGTTGKKVTRRFEWATSTIVDSILVYPAAALAGTSLLGCEPINPHSGDVLICELVPRDLFKNPTNFSLHNNLIFPKGNLSVPLVQYVNGSDSSFRIFISFIVGGYSRDTVGVGINISGSIVESVVHIATPTATLIPTLTPEPMPISTTAIVFPARFLLDCTSQDAGIVAPGSQITCNITVRDQFGFPISGAQADDFTVHLENGWWDQPTRVVPIPATEDSSPVIVPWRFVFRFSVGTVDKKYVSARVVFNYPFAETISERFWRQDISSSGPIDRTRTSLDCFPKRSFAFLTVICIATARDRQARPALGANVTEYKFSTIPTTSFQSKDGLNSTHVFFTFVMPQSDVQVALLFRNQTVLQTVQAMPLSKATSANLANEEKPVPAYLVLTLLLEGFLAVLLGLAFLLVVRSSQSNVKPFLGV
eukprot:TRINITY_DN6581_c0_g1_i5.p1 TRINITY_DN6581_c0_g1~~TRINITY_DN6581_c0_g1_i5.p1  ORF type:complete len:3617 (-),score=329.07 TRINITY_DN6581_c0_g1_i5:585-11435(-)